MSKLEDELLMYIHMWLYHNNKMRELNNYLYNHTELFERKYESDYNHELFDFFAGKITRFSRDENRLREILDERQTIKLNTIKLLER